jgi:hypothetical protein
MLTIPSLTTATGSVIFNEIEVNDVDVTNGGLVAIDRGEDVDIRVELSSPEDYDDVRVKASVDGYEYDDIEESSNIFDIRGSTGVYTKYLHLNIPEDIDSGNYALNIEVKNALGSRVMGGIILQVGEARHSLSIQDVILRPTSTVEAGRPLGVEVRLENLGSRKEEDIRVSASLKDLGVSTRAYLDELGYEETNSDDDETSGSVMLYLPVPADAVSGEYTLDVEVEYSRGHEVVSESAKVYVSGTTANTEVNTIISIDSVSKAVEKGEQVTYKLMLANLGSNEAVYSLAVSGTQAWADVSLNPGFVRVQPNGAGELTLTVTPKDRPIAGEHTFTLQIKENDKVLRSVDLTSVVTEGRNWTSVKSVLEIGFAVLISLLVILGLIVAFKKLGGNDHAPEQPMMDEGQSYY